MAAGGEILPAEKQPPEASGSPGMILQVVQEHPQDRFPPVPPTPVFSLSPLDPIG